jgi:hypothetical protein
VPHRFLRDGGGETPLVIREASGPHRRPPNGLIGEWPLHGTATPQTAILFAVPDGFEYWTTDAGRFHLDLANGTIDVPPMEDEILREQRLHGMPMLLQFAHRGDFSLHAAAVEVEGRAAILAAPSRFGKTTLALAFHRLGYRVLTEDLACIRPDTMEILPGPAMLRVRPDVLAGDPPAGTELVAARPDRVFLRLDASRRGSTRPVPIAGTFFLREGDAVQVSPAPSLASLPDFWRLGYRLPTADGRAASFRQLARLAAEIPVWNVRRPFRLDALEETVGRIADRVLR